MEAPDVTQSPHVGGEDIETKSSELRQRVQNSPQFHNEVDRIIAELKKAITKGDGKFGESSSLHENGNSGARPEYGISWLVDFLRPLLLDSPSPVEPEVRENVAGNSGPILDAEIANIQAANEPAVQVRPEGQPAIDVVPDDDGTIGASVLQEDTERHVVTLPLKSIAHPPNMNYRTRAHALEDMHENVSSPGGVCVIYGVSGVGKTSLAVEYVYNYRQNFDCVFWLQADTDPGLAQSYRLIAITLALVDGTEDQNRIVELGREWLSETEQSWLLIFDNVERWELLAHYLPVNLPATRGSVLVTTQMEDMTKLGTSSVFVQPFTTDEGAAMLLDRIQEESSGKDPDIKSAKEISILVGGLPVALANVAGYINYTHCALAELLELFKESQQQNIKVTLEGETMPDALQQGSLTCGETLAVMEYLTSRELPGDCQDFLYILAYIDCENVREDILHSVQGVPFLEFLDTRQITRYNRAKKQLLKRHLIQERIVGGHRCLSMHRSLQRTTWDKLSKNSDKQQEVFDAAIAMLRKAIPAVSPIQVPEPGKWYEHQLLVPHVLTLRSVYQEFRTQIHPSLDFVRLLMNPGVNQWERGLVRDGLLLIKTAEDVLLLISNNGYELLRADIHTTVALLYDDTGVTDRAEALERRKKCLDIRQAYAKQASSISRDEDILLYNAWMDYVLSLMQYNKYQEAEPILKTCLAKYQSWGSEADIPFEYAKYHHWMGMVQMYKGDFEQAIELTQHGVKLMTDAGKASMMNRFKFDLACIILQSGDLERALAMQEEVYESRIVLNGKANELTLESAYAIGALHEHRGQLAEAESWFMRAFEYRNVAYWSQEAIARTKFHLSSVWRAQLKKPQEALRLYEEAKPVLDQLLPLHHPEKLREVKDESILFDNILTVLAARFTGPELLPYVQ